MTPRKPSAVQGLRRGVGSVQADSLSKTTVKNSPQRGRDLTPEFDSERPPRPEKPVRFTLDLDQERHAFLKTFALECGAGTGGAAVMRALLDELRDSTTLGMKVRARLRAGERR